MKLYLGLLVIWLCLAAIEGGKGGRCNRRCPKKSKEVCGSDGVTYRNRCLLKVANCRKPGVRIRIAHKGSCAANVCRLPVAPGPCRAYFPRWYFDHEQGICKSFIYGGCRGNDNQFNTKEECEASCVCRLPKAPGPCKAAIPSWYFNHKKGKCQEFTYGGCQGNANRFSTQATCTMTCGCPKDQISNCLVDPCESATCPAHQDATCKANYCNGCHAHFYSGDETSSPPDQAEGGHRGDGQTVSGRIVNCLR